MCQGSWLDAGVLPIGKRLELDEIQTFLAGAEPGSGGRIPRPPVVGGASPLGDGAERRCLDALNPRGTRGARIAPQTPLRMYGWYASLACLRPLLNGRLSVGNE